MILLLADFFPLAFAQNLIRNIMRKSNSLYPDQSQHKIGTDLGQECLQRLSAEGTSRLRVKEQCLSLNYHFQQCGSLTSVDSDEPMQPPFKLRNSK